MFKTIMRKLAPFVSIFALVMILLFATQVFLGNQSKELFIIVTNISTLLWFVFSPFWLIADKKKDQ